MEAGRMFQWAIAIAVAIVFWRLGYRLVGFVGRRQPPPPPPGELRKVNLRYRCTTCGTEIRMTSAVDDTPVPPRHCMDEMEQIALPIE